MSCLDIGCEYFDNLMELNCSYSKDNKKCIKTENLIASDTVLDEVSELLPCPFCGGAGIITFIGPHKHFNPFMPDKTDWSAFIECSNCTCAIGTDGETQDIVKRRVTQEWNKRAN